MNEMTVALQGDHYTLSFRYTGDIALLVRKIPSARYSSRTGWTVSAKDKALLKEAIEYIIRRKLASVSESAIPNKTTEKEEHDTFADKLLIKPYGYQLEGIRYMLRHKRTFNCDDMGLGKTFQAVATVHAANAYPCLVIPPASMKITWKREFRSIAGVVALVIDDNNDGRWYDYLRTGTCKVVIVNYESLRKRFFKKSTTKVLMAKPDDETLVFKSIVVDESHRCKERNTQWSRLVEALARGKEYRFLLTGTPIVTGNEDLIQQLRILGRLDDLGGESAFRDKYCGKGTGEEALSELNVSLQNTCYIRRDKRLALSGLPEKERLIHRVDITNRQEYDVAEKDIIRYLQEYAKAKDESVRKAIRGKVIVQMSVLRKITASGKITEALELISEITGKGEKVIVFTAHKSVANDISFAYNKTARITGDETTEEKQAAIDSFQRDADCKVALVNIKSGGVGITLTSACNVVFVELPWTAADCDQCECRSHRNGQEKPVRCIYIIGKDTIDERMLRIIKRERYNSDAVTGTRDTTRESVFGKACRLYSNSLQVYNH